MSAQQDRMYAAVPDRGICGRIVAASHAQRLALGRAARMDDL